MANNVHWSLSFRSINDEAKARFVEMQSRIRNEGLHSWFADMWVDGKDGSPTYDETEKYEWTTNNIGPKWCYVEDMEDDYMSGESAWSAPEQGIETIISELSELDPEMITIFTYEDEMPNFFGIGIYEGADLVDGFEDEYDDLIQRAISSHPDELDGNWNAEEECWMNEEAEEFFYDVQYEIMGDAQMSLADETANWIKERKEESVE